MRIVKEPEVRKNEILDAAEKLFAVKGFEAATVNDILSAVAIAANPALSPEDKLLAVMLAQQSQTPDEKELLPVVHEPVNALFHQKIISGYVLGLSPILTDIIMEGIAQKRFSVPHPRETVPISPLC